jgi:hypothetical protein
MMLGNVIISWPHPTTAEFVVAVIAFLPLWGMRRVRLAEAIRRYRRESEDQAAIDDPS